MDDRNTRELTIAYTAIVVVLAIACGLQLAVQLLFGLEPEPLDGPTAWIGDWLAHEAAPQ
jgi:hypothetical protein